MGITTSALAVLRDGVHLGKYYGGKAEFRPIIPYLRQGQDYDLMITFIMAKEKGKKKKHLIGRCISVVVVHDMIQANLYYPAAASCIVVPMHSHGNFSVLGECKSNTWSREHGLFQDKSHYLIISCPVTICDVRGAGREQGDIPNVNITCQHKGI